jgi:arylsulfatase A-like enzyme
MSQSDDATRGVRAGLVLVLVVAVFAVVFSIWLNRQKISLSEANVVFVMVDALRSDHLGCYGYPLPTSPFIDQVAKRSVVFDNVTSPSSQTVPSVISIFTGLYPRRHGNQYFAPTNSFRIPRKGTTPQIPEDLPLLAEQFRAMGYRTGAVVTNPWISPAYGFGRGFERYHYLTEPGRGPYPGGAAVNLLADQLLREWREQRFFLYLHYMDVHAPYVPPPSYRETFGKPHAGGELLFRDGPAPEASPRDVAYTRAMYDAEIRGLDDLVKEIFEALERLQLAGTTLVLITADHGDEFHEHGGLGHGWTLFDEVIRPPLLVYHPQLEPFAGRISLPVSSVDLMPTLIALVGGTITPDVEGVSFAPVILGATPSVRAADGLVFTELGRFKAVRGPRYKLIRRLPEGEELAFDLAEDPTEHRAVPPDGSGPSALRDHLDQFIRGTRTFPTPGADEVLDRATAERLRALGYGD